MPDEMERDGSEDELIERAAAVLRAPVRLSEAVDARVMDDVRAGSAERGAGSGRGSVWRWITEPRTVRISPLVGLLAAAALVAIVVRLDRVASAVHPETVAASAPPDESGPAARATLRSPGATLAHSALTQFVLVAPAASRVSVVGDFNGWDTSATPLVRQASGGVWTVTVPLAAGRHTYTFVVDGSRWVADPSAPADNDDDFGRPNSVVTVAGA